jgi:hypothetical protein
MVEMPVLNKRRYQKRPLDNPKKWVVTDTQLGEIVYRGNFENVSIACYNLNKKFYMAEA